MEVFEIVVPGELARVDAVGDFAREIQRRIAIGDRDSLVLRDRRGHLAAVVVGHVLGHDKVKLDDVRKRIQRANVAHHALDAAEHVRGVGGVRGVVHRRFEEQEIDRPVGQDIAFQAKRVGHGAERANARVDERELRPGKFLREIIAGVLPPSATRRDRTAEEDHAPGVRALERAPAVRQAVAQFEIVMALGQHVRGVGRAVGGDERGKRREQQRDESCVETFHFDVFGPDFGDGTVDLGGTLPAGAGSCGFGPPDPG